MSSELTAAPDVRTEFQVPRSQSFAPGPIKKHSNPSKLVSDDAPHTPLLAKPAEWTKDGYMPCVAPRHFSLIEKLNHWAQWDDVTVNTDAKALCEGCPVLQQCREAAMLEEVHDGSSKAELKGKPLSAPNRYTVRGGWTPEERAHRAEVTFVDIGLRQVCGKGHIYAEVGVYVTKYGRECKGCKALNWQKPVECPHCGKTLKKGSYQAHRIRFHKNAEEVAA